METNSYAATVMPFSVKRQINGDGKTALSGAQGIDFSTRKDWIEIAKGIGIILVVYGHAARGAVSAGLAVDPPKFLAADSIIYCFHMPLFFFLSGLFFVGSWRKRGNVGLIANKLDTLVYPYLVWSVLQGLTEVAFSRWTNGHVSLETVSRFLWLPHGQLWFLYGLFTVTMAAILVYTIAHPRYELAALGISFVAYVIRARSYDAPQIEYIASFFCFFAMGVSFDRLARWTHRHRLSLLITTALSSISLQYVFHKILHHTYVDGGPVALLVAVSCIACVVTLSMCIERMRWNILITIGSASMAIYLMHVSLTSGIRILAVHMFHSRNIGFIVLLGSIVGVMAPLAFAVLSLRTKLQYLLRIPEGLSLERRWLRWHSRRRTIDAAAPGI